MMTHYSRLHKYSLLTSSNYVYIQRHTFVRGRPTLKDVDLKKEKRKERKRKRKSENKVRKKKARKGMELDPYTWKSRFQDFYYNATFAHVM